MNEISTEVITHKLKIKWENPKYITNKQAEFVFNQLIDKNTKMVTWINTQNKTYIQRYKTDVELIVLDDETRDIEDLLFLSWLSEQQKEDIRQIIADRKTKGQKTDKNTVQYIINKKFNS